ncbi:peptide/nickel transport system substrate-binding protein [Kineococcus radiotolerans]|uniref:Peptide/nickel transport system substrate-binding protein n=1 Tax=Kineococcus radiotolerans TaxID=131568 RepID=A0A7W4TP97_KINRA|nr:ABC transporter substrate-binding protein [Kineococcus radiotolerans]MBB2902203.1 peptide/nickel transport system substrate-binding protein [Kineococcus radiotolerans]
MSEQQPGTTDRLKRRSLLATLAAAPLAPAVLSACSTGESVDTGDDGGTGGGAGGFVAAISARPDQYDPHKTTAYASFQVLENVYDTLVVPGADDLSMQPSLATDWETSDDELTWTFTLRDGVTFHDGSPFTAEDVVFSYRRIIDQDLANSSRFATVAEVSAPDPTHVVVALTSPTPNLLSRLGGFKGMAILPRTVDEASLTTAAVGTGPFRLESTSADEISLERFDGYWGEAPRVGGLTFRVVPEPAAALTALTGGQVQWTDNVPPQQVEKLSGDDSVELGRVASVDYWYLAMNCAKAPFDRVDVRRAVAFALDREAVTEAAKFDTARVNQTAIPEASEWYHDYAPFTTDVDRARQLLAGAGVGGPLTMGLMVTSEYPETVTAAQVVASQLEPLGITVDIQTEDFATWLDRQGRGDFDAFVLGWLGNIDPADFYEDQHRTGGSNNYQKYSNPVTDDLLDRAKVEPDQAARKALYDRAAEQIVDDVSYLYLYNPDAVQAWEPGITGYEVRADKAVNFDTVTLPS